jgi:hypothetical protein
MSKRSGALTLCLLLLAVAVASKTIADFQTDFFKRISADPDNVYDLDVGIDEFEDGAYVLSYGDFNNDT